MDAITNLMLLLQTQIETEMKAIWTILLLIASNVFMTFAWYGHLKLQEMKISTNCRLLW